MSKENHTTQSTKDQQMFKIIIGFLGTLIIIGTFFIGYIIGNAHHLGKCEEIFENEGSFKGMGGRPPLEGLWEKPLPQRFGTHGIIISISYDEMLIQTKDGDEREVTFSPQTEVLVGQKKGSLDDLKTNLRVMVVGRPLPDNDLQARIIHIEKK